MESHVLWRRLIEKSDQFSHATENLPRVLFVCDGGCAALRDSSGTGPMDYHCDEMVNHFWGRRIFSEGVGWTQIVETGISAAIVLPIVPVSMMFCVPGRREFVLKPRFYPNPYSNFPVDRTTAELLERVVSSLPPPVESPDNVMRAIRAGRTPSRRLGYLGMTNNKIEISGADLLRILAGELSSEEFCRRYSHTSNPFKNALMTFRFIKSVTIEPVSDRDDDKVAIEFGPPDAALGPFMVP